MEIIVAVDGPVSKEGNPKAYRTTKKLVNSYIHLQRELINLPRILEM